MECVKSFVIRSTGNENVSSAGSSLDTWGISPRISWAYQKGSGNSTFNIQGFKNINIHSIEVVGDFATSSMNAGFSSVVSNWAFYLQINGKMPYVSGFITPSPNDYAISYPSINPIIALGSFTPKMVFFDPIQSVQNIQIIDIRASGTSAESLTTVNIGWFVNFIINYSYEGEEQ